MMAPGDVAPPRRSLRGTLARWLLAAVAVAVVGLVAGLLAGRSQPRLAAGALVADFVVPEPTVVEAATSGGAASSPADPALVAPSSGRHRGDVRCGIVDEVVDNDTHLATLAAGGIVVRFRDVADGPAVAAWAQGRTWLLTSPEPRLEVPVVALAWGRRMELPAVSEPLLTAFAVAEVGFLPAPDDCTG